MHAEAADDHEKRERDYFTHAIPACFKSDSGIYSAAASSRMACA
jgi:hypothetical protein